MIKSYCSGLVLGFALASVFFASAANVEWTGAGADDKWKTSLSFYWNDYEPVEGMFALRAGLGFATIYSVVSQNPSSLSLVQN